MKITHFKLQSIVNGRRSISPLLFVLLIFSLSLLALPQSAHSQNSPITATVNHSDYSTDELVILTVTVVDDSPQQPRPILPPLTGLTVVDFDIATNVSTVNGQIQTEVIYTYQLQPRRTGTLTIPPVTVKIDGEIFEAPPITISVSQGAAPAPSPGNAVPPNTVVPPPRLNEQDFFVESLVDLSDPFIGQQVIYTVRFYQAIKLYQKPQFEMPLFNGFDTLGLPVQEYNLDIDGRTYLITEFRTALFPKTAGNISIGPARLAFPGNFFEEPVELYSEPTALQVKSLPDNPPPGFNGAVGQYQIEAWFSPQIAVVNQPATFSVAVSGTGNIHKLSEPIWPNLNNWRAYDTLASVSTELKNGQIVGTRIYERLIVSDKVGDFIIPPTKLVFFDPVAAEYHTISTKSLSGRIIPAPTPNPGTATAVALNALATATPVGSRNTLGTPVPAGGQPVIRISPDSLESTWRTILPVGFVLLWTICGAIPIAAAMGAGVFWMWQKRQQQRQAAAQALQQPRQKMHPFLAQAIARTDDNYKAVNQALNSYLGDTLNASVKGLTLSELANRLKERGLEQKLVNQIKETLSQSEMGRYGPKSEEDRGWGLLTETDALLFRLDKVFGKH